ncbi:MAG: hypothetical protein V4613_12525 [Bacteroidota bacterium]
MDFNLKHQAYISELNQTLSKIDDIDLAKKRLTYLRWKVAENLDKLLFEFETNIRKTDGTLVWAPAIEQAIEQLSKHLAPYNNVRFIQHQAVKRLVSGGSVKVPEIPTHADAVVIGAKFLLANTGNFFSAFHSLEEYESLLQAKKIIVIGGIDSFLASQNDLPIAKQLYSIFETGKISYEAEILSRPGKARGMTAEIVLILIDDKRSQLLENPVHRPLFSLLNFELPPVCPLEQIRTTDRDDWQSVNSLDYFLYPFTHQFQNFTRHFLNNYGLKLLNNYIPYDMDLSDHVMEARVSAIGPEKKNPLMSIIDSDRSSVVLNSKKFKDKQQFEKYAALHFFGK